MRVLLIGLLAASGLSAQVNLYSIEKENATGKELAKGLEKHFTLVQSDVVEELGRQLVSTIPDIPFNITFRVFESAKVQARQIPGTAGLPAESGHSRIPRAPCPAGRMDLCSQPHAARLVS